MAHEHARKARVMDGREPESVAARDRPECACACVCIYI